MKILKRVIFLISVVCFIIFASLVYGLDNKTNGREYVYETKYYLKTGNGQDESYKLTEAEIELNLDNKGNVSLIIEEDEDYEELNNEENSSIVLSGKYNIRDGYLYVDFEKVHFYDCIGKINAYKFNPNENIDKLCEILVQNEFDGVKRPWSGLEYCFDDNDVMYECEDNISKRQAYMICLVSICVITLLCLIWVIVDSAKFIKECNKKKVENKTVKTKEVTEK